MAGAFTTPDVQQPGADWRLLVSDRFLGAFGPATTAATMSELWHIAVDPSLGLDALVAAVPTRGAAAVDAFAIAGLGRSTTFVVRGGACADVSVAGRMRRIDARGGEPWYVAELQGVERFAIGPLQRSPGDLRPGRRDRPVDGGVVIGPWLGWAIEFASPMSRPTDVTPAARRAETGPVPSTGRRAAPAPAPMPTPAAAPVPTPEPAGAPRAAVAGWPGDAAPRPSRPPLPERQPQSYVAYPAQVPAPAPEAALAAANPYETNVLGDLGRRAANLRRHRAEPPATAPTPETLHATAFRIGERPPERVDAPVYVGRQPRSPRVTGPMLPRLVRVDSPSREVSATHIELRPTGDGLLLTDMESTNGTVVRQPGKGVRRLESGESLPVVPGTLIDIGDGNVIEILAYR